MRGWRLALTMTGVIILLVALEIAWVYSMGPI